MTRCICLDTILHNCFNDSHYCICLKNTPILSCKAIIHRTEPTYQEWHNYLYFNNLLDECFCHELHELEFMWCNYLQSHNCICVELTKHALGTESCRGEIKSQQHLCVCSYISDSTYQKCKAKNTKHFSLTC